jgi:hypothetical protein
MLFFVSFSLLSLVSGFTHAPDALGSNKRHLSRRAAAFPPKLTDEESILVNAFDNASIAESSSYYAHGLHLAGTNKSQAQWTADRWASFGFQSRLVEYGENIIVHLFCPFVNNIDRGLHKLPCLPFFISYVFEWFRVPP